MSLVAALFGTAVDPHPVPPAPRVDASPKTESLEDVLLELSKWGQPRVSQFKDGEWACTVDANITPLGAKFEVRSDFSCKTPTQAALQCRERLLASIKIIGGVE